jgi:hypothetical protein
MKRASNSMRHARQVHSVNTFWGSSLRMLGLSWLVIALLGLLDTFAPGLMCGGTVACELVDDNIQRAPAVPTTSHAEQALSPQPT